MKLNFAYIILMALVLVSCEEEIYIDIKSVEKHVVVNSIFSPTEEFSLSLSFTRNVLDPLDTKEFIDNAEVSVYDESDSYLFSLDHVEQGKYVKSGLFPLAGKIYKLKIKVDGHPIITAESLIPLQATVENLQTRSVEIDGNAALQVDFDIVDSDESNNYYIWEVISANEVEGVPENNPSTLDIITLQDVNSYQSGGTRWSKLFLSDELFAGNSISNSFISISNSPEGPVETTPTDEQKSFLKLITASQDMYLYYLSVERYRKQNDINTSTGVPIEIHSNIEGGLGIFAGFNQQLIEL